MLYGERQQRTPIKVHRADTLVLIIGTRHILSFSLFHSGWIASKINSCGPTHSEIVNVQILFSSSSAAERLFLVEPKQLQCISCPKKDELSCRILRAWQAAGAIPIIHFYGTKSQSTDLVPWRLEGVEGAGASLFLISIFHSVLLLFCLSLFASPNHKSLLDPITGSELQWRGGRIDSRAEDERRKGGEEVL